jgi:hypothetical protein
MVWNGGGACKNPWRLARGKRFPARGEVYPAGRCNARQRKTPESRRRRAGGPEPWAAQGRSGVRAGFEPEGGYLVLPVTNAQHEGVQGAVKDGIGV